MKPSIRAALLAATLMASATAQFTFSDDSGGESTAVPEVVLLEAGDDQSTGEINQRIISHGVVSCALMVDYAFILYLCANSRFGNAYPPSNPWRGGG